MRLVLDEARPREACPLYPSLPDFGAPAIRVLELLGELRGWKRLWVYSAMCGVCGEEGGGRRGLGGGLIPAPVHSRD